jgi:hypothetical protein
MNLNDSEKIECRLTRTGNNNRARRLRESGAKSPHGATIMKPVGLISAGVLLLLLGVAAPSYAQEQQAKPEKQEQQGKPEKQQQAKPARQEQQQARGQQDQNRQQQQNSQQQRQNQNRQQQQNAQQQRQDQRQQQANHPSQQEQRGQQVAWQDHRAHNWQSEHRNWQERGGYNGYRIPDDRYRGDFGQDHSFRIYGLPELVVGGYPRFQYDGFWFSLVDPWPEAWSDNWYDSDEVYIAYTDGGYYLYDRSHPGVGIAVSVYAN